MSFSKILFQTHIRNSQNVLKINPNIKLPSSYVVHSLIYINLDETQSLNFDYGPIARSTFKLERLPSEGKKDFIDLITLCTRIILHLI